MSWAPIINQRFTPQQFAHYVDTLTWGAWQPEFCVVHNTGSPTLAQRLDGFTAQHMLNFEHYYRDQLGWSAGPHCFVDQHGIWVFTPLTSPGVHSPSYNHVSWGIEALGDYDTEQVPPGLYQHLVACLALLHGARGLAVQMLRFHKEDPATTHRHCPGAHLDKTRLTQDLTAALAQGLEGRG